jgi:hypothetical protein
VSNQIGPPIKIEGVVPGPDGLLIVEFEIPPDHPAYKIVRNKSPHFSLDTTPIGPLQRIPCPFDTNGDGDCGRRHCPHCGGV